MKRTSSSFSCLFVGASIAASVAVSVVASVAACEHPSSPTTAAPASSTSTAASTSAPKSVASHTSSTSVSATVSPAPPPSPPALATLLATLDDPAKATALATSDPIAFAWMLFEYVDWPAVGGKRGVPDPAKSFGADGPVVWGTWKITDEVYLPTGSKPDPWPSGDPNAIPVLSDAMIDGTKLVDPRGNSILYEVRMSQATFDYLLSRQLYSFTGQQAVRTGSGPAVAFPTSALEIKASWRVLDPVKDKDVLGHYLTKNLRFGGVTVLGGLTGLHISSKALPKWLWTTFEQIDDPTTTGATLELPIAPEVQASNAAMQQAFAGTRWAYYRMIGVETSYVDRMQKPALLASSQMETRFQHSSSCITCHSLASIGATSNPRFSFFKIAPGGMSAYVGFPPTLPADMKPLDFVWSMRRAK